MILIGRGLDLEERKLLKRDGVNVRSTLCGFQGVCKARRREGSESGRRVRWKLRRKARRRAQARRISGDNSLRDPPVPIPNTEVKPQHADGTWLETARESRSSPDPNSRTFIRVSCFLMEKR